MRDPPDRGCCGGDVGRSLGGLEFGRLRDSVDGKFTVLRMIWHSKFEVLFGIYISL